MGKNLHELIVCAEEFELINSPAFYDCIVHLICTSGSGSFLYNDRLFTLSEKDIAVISKPQLVSRMESDEGFRCVYVAAPDRFLHNLLPANNYSIQGCVSLFDNPIINVSEIDARRFQADIANIRARIDNTDHQFYQELMGSLLQTMVYDLFDFHAKTNVNILTTDRIGYITRQFFTLIEAGRPKTQREVSYYAAQLNVTSKYLSDTIKRVTGSSVSTHINNAATSIALGYLKDDSMSISQIADEMNFSSLSYFSRFCVKHIGVSPVKFRTAGAKD
ncbi:MAG: AraC family transcriptional regulator [Bacteroides sp.]|nr:AraC family transcriptional regulator [Bacteroides sp.]MBD5373847.1 AraC family transcriptional regulator [Bacteroides sp.]